MEKQMEMYKEQLQAMINQYMRDYELTEDDIRFGNAQQIKGVVLGIKMALAMLDNVGVNKHIEITDTMTNANEQLTIRKIPSTKRAKK